MFGLTAGSAQRDHEAQRRRIGALQLPVDAPRAAFTLLQLHAQLIDQLLSHDTLVLAVPMYNLGIPSTLKSWIDRVSRAGKTFRYTAEGPVGMVENMHAYLVFARGGIYRDTPLDTQTGYLKSVLGLMGIQSVETIFAEGLNMGEETREEDRMRLPFLSAALPIISSYSMCRICGLHPHKRAGFLPACLSQPGRFL